MISQLIYNGKNLREFGITIEHLPESVHPQRRGDAYRIAGRNGTRRREDGTFENYDQPYEVWFKDSAANRDGYQLSRDLAGFLRGSSDFCRLEDTYEPDVFRLACYAGPMNVAAVLRRYGRATLVFDCLPERYLKSGEKAITLFENVMDLSRPATAAVHNPTEFIAAPLIRITGTGEFIILKSAHHAADAMEIVVSLDSSEAETIEIDCESYAIRTVGEIAGTTVYNDASGKVRYLTHYPTLARLDPGENTIRLELYDVLHQPNIQKFEIVPRWWTA